MKNCCCECNEAHEKPLTVALVGNPNCGKTTLFNALTGARQRVGNWPGVTVERKCGALLLEGKTVHVVDLPGVYSIDGSCESIAVDERIACDFILQQQADVIINIVDASHLERHLYLTTQLLEIGVPVILVLNMMDIARARRIEIDVEGLERELGCKVVTIEAHKNKGVDGLSALLVRHCEERFLRRSNPDQPFWIASAKKRPRNDAVARYAFIEHVIKTCVTALQKKTTWTQRIDHLVLNRILGIPVFLAVMYALFYFSINIGGALQDVFDTGSELIFVDGTANLLTSWNAPSWMIAFISNGIGKGINTTLTFIPVIGALFLFLAFLEDSGYMARAAFVVDRLMRLLGLPGKAFIPMIVGFGCNVPAVMAARTLENKRDRIISIMMSPFMSCGARLAIYAVFVTAFFPVGGQNIVFALYLIGILMAVLTGFILRRTVLKGDPAPLLMELPAYHVPRLRSIFQQAWQRLKGFVFRAGKLIIPICVLIGVLNGLHVDGTLVTGEADSQSLLSVAGQAITPLFAPMGIQADNWPATVGLLTGVLAKEVVVGTLNALNEGMYGLMYQRFDGQIGAFAYLLFVLLYFPCVSTMAAMLRELHRGWAIFSACWTTGVAYAAAVLFYQAATWMRHPASSSLWIAGMLSLFFGTILLMRWYAAGLKGQVWIKEGISIPGCAKGKCTTCPARGAL